MGTQSIAYGSKLSQPTSSKFGYTVEGWYTEAGFTNKWDFSSRTVTGITKLYAKWVPNTYIIAFNANGGTGAMANQVGVVYGVTTPLKANSYAKEGHEFVGWATSASGAVAYTDKASVTSLVALGTTTLYAKWMPKSYNVTFDLDGGDGVATPIQAPFGSVIGNPGVPTKIGYTFQGWYKDAAKSVAWSFAADTVGVATIIYAKWASNSYAVHFDSNGGSGAPMENQTFTYGAANKALTKATYTKTGYIFAGWSKTQDGPKDFDNEQAVRNLTASGTLNLYAVWTPITYSVAFHPGTGTGTMETQAEFTYDTPKALTPNLFTKQDHSFVGWATEENGLAVYQDKESVTTLSATQGATADLYAIWSINTYTVSFQSNGGTEVAPLGAVFDTTIIKPEDPTREGYAFAGWYRNQSLNVAWDFANDKVQDATVLWAKWTAVVDVDVPIDPKIMIDAQGKVSSGPEATRFFASKSPKDVYVTEVTCTSTSTTETLFPNKAQWPGIKVSLTNPDDPYGGTEVRLDKSVSAYFEIPAASPSAPTSLPITFGLTLPADIKLSYADAPEGVPVATLSYTFELMG